MISDKKCPFCLGKQRALKEIQKEIQKKFWCMISDKKCPFCSGRERAWKEIQKKYWCYDKVDREMRRGGKLEKKWNK